MKKFIILLICLFLGAFISTNHSTDTIKKNDITTLAVCTDNNATIVVADVISADYSFINTGSSLYYHLNSIDIANINSSNNHSTITNSVRVYMSYIISRISNTLTFTTEVARISTRTLGLLGTIVNKVAFNQYLYHSNNKLGNT
jgi:hypothetical protein